MMAERSYEYRQLARSVRMPRRSCLPNFTSGLDLMPSSRPRSMIRPYAHQRVAPGTGRAEHDFVPVTNLQTRQLGRERRQPLLNLASDPLFNVNMFYLDGRPDFPHARQLFHP